MKQIQLWTNICPSYSSSQMELKTSRTSNQCCATSSMCFWKACPTNIRLRASESWKSSIFSIWVFCWLSARRVASTWYLRSQLASLHLFQTSAASYTHLKWSTHRSQTSTSSCWRRCWAWSESFAGFRRLAKSSFASAWNRGLLIRSWHRWGMTTAETTDQLQQNGWSKL